MGDRMTHHSDELSGGQKQRVAIARAVANNPSIILADEPTGALDSKTGRKIMDLFHTLHHEQGKTIVLITHSQGVSRRDRAHHHPKGWCDNRGTKRRACMLIWENVKLALSGLLGNKMRSLLTMLGIIIGIGSVIAIMTVSSSLTTSITDEFAQMGANNITVGLKKQSDEEETRSNGMKFGVSNRQISLEEDDRITDDMITALKKKFSTSVDSISLEESVGSGTVKSGEDTANVSLSGINTGYFDANDITLFSRTLSDRQRCKGKEKVSLWYLTKWWMRYFDGDTSKALSQKINIDINNVYYSFLYCRCL